MKFKTIEPIKGKIRILDQRQLPLKIVYKDYDDFRDIIESIKRLEIRGAPAIGIAGAFALALAARAEVKIDPERLKCLLTDVAMEIKSARPTAVNLSWAVDRALKAACLYEGDNLEELRIVIWDEAINILREDEQMCHAIGQKGAKLIKNGDTILTHCNAGALGTGGIGTALAIIYTAHNQGKRIRVYADETRPILQGARLTCWELMQAGIDTVLICDNMVGFLMKQKKIDLVIVGADRIVKNGDFANKIGTYGVAVLAEKHKVPFYTAAPSSSFDNHIASGEDIPIEERSPNEITIWNEIQIAPAGVKVYNPAFDITPAELVTAYITDKGIIPGGRCGGETVPTPPSGEFN
ncbi:MAG: S-methyl-5-thioribose-1-phosphate isomerase [candidate division Zixibacteria bacterium]|nr:S-methyl-5-thioribose-1-phosphate isomerase [candidate division Zixibacteria bacterium]